MITLHTLLAASAQEVFDQCAAHLLTQNKKAVSTDGGTCVYHTKFNSLRCAAGCFIADDEYKLSMEGHRWGNLMITPSIIDMICHATPSYKYVPHVRLIKRLQDIHDGAETHAWSAKLTLLAAHYDLSDIVIKRITQPNLLSISA